MASITRHINRNYNCRRVYLLSYNIVMFAGFAAVNTTLLIKICFGSMDDDNLLAQTNRVRLLTYIQLLEAIHPILGIVPGQPFMPLMQVFARTIINLILLNQSIRQESALFLHYLFSVWTISDAVRYSFYALRLFKMNQYPITWARYTIFLLLYPMGGICELLVLLMAAKHFEQTGAYSFSLHNAANISFHLSSFLRFYAYLLAPIIFTLMKYMWNQRCKQLKAKSD